MHQVPGVERAALTGQVPLSGDSDVYGVQFEVNGTDPAASGGAFRYAVSPGYFETMGIPIRRGRGITADDRASAPLAVVISESLARSQFPDRDPIGERLHIGPTDRPWYTVVGVAGNVTAVVARDAMVRRRLRRARAMAFWGSRALAGDQGPR